MSKKIKSELHNLIILDFQTGEVHIYKILFDYLKDHLPQIVYNLGHKESDTQYMIMKELKMIIH